MHRVLLEANPECETTIKLHSCSKTFNMAGLRIGFAVGNTDAIEVLAAYRTNVGLLVTRACRLNPCHAANEILGNYR